VERANDADYGQAWRSSGYPCWIAYDLSSVPDRRRERVYSVWSNTDTYDYDAVFAGQRTYNVPGDYVLEAHPAPGGGEPPARGWTTLVEERGSHYHSAAHLLDLGGATWLRLRASAGSDLNAPENQDCALQWDVHDASADLPESWMFYGDSITAGAMAPYPGLRDADGGPVPTFSELVHAARPERFPAQQSGGVGGMSLDHALSSGALTRWLSDYEGTHVGLGLGLNDVNSDAFDAAAFYDDLQSAVQLVTESGKTPVVPTLVASRAPRVQAHGPRANAAIRRLYQQHPEVVEGPDLWSLFSARPELISEDLLHPTEVGYAEIRRAWAQTAVEAL
jgi:lysophospholipase L1-like esterase